MGELLHVEPAPRGLNAHISRKFASTVRPSGGVLGHHCLILPHFAR